MMAYASWMLSKMIVSILTSVDQREQAEWIAQQLLKKRIAACVQQTSGTSNYIWRGKLEHSQEYYLAIKTTAKLQCQVVSWLEENHPYELPEIIVLEGQCSDAYSDWLALETAG